MEFLLLPSLQLLRFLSLPATQVLSPSPSPSPSQPQAKFRSKRCSSSWKELLQDLALALRICLTMLANLTPLLGVLGLTLMALPRFLYVFSFHFLKLSSNNFGVWSNCCAQFSNFYDFVIWNGFFFVCGKWWSEASYLGITILEFGEYLELQGLFLVEKCSWIELILNYRVYFLLGIILSFWLKYVLSID